MKKKKGATEPSPLQLARCVARLIKARDRCQHQKQKQEEEVFQATKQQSFSQIVGTATAAEVHESQRNSSVLLPLLPMRRSAADDGQSVPAAERQQLFAGVDRFTANIFRALLQQTGSEAERGSGARAELGRRRSASTLIGLLPKNSYSKQQQQLEPFKQRKRRHKAVHGHHIILQTTAKSSRRGRRSPSAVASAGGVGGGRRRNVAEKLPPLLASSAPPADFLSRWLDNKSHQLLGGSQNEETGSRRKPPFDAPPTIQKLLQLQRYYRHAMHCNRFAQRMNAANSAYAHCL